LPKKKFFRGQVTATNVSKVIEDEEYMLYDRPIQRTGLFGRSRRLGNEKKDKKRSRSEEHNKNVSKECLIASSKSISKLCKNEKLNMYDLSNYSQNQQMNSSSLINQKQGKKQHKIRRKLLMGGLIKRKNRSMPDLRESQNGQKSTISEGFNCILPKHSIDDSNIGLKVNGISEVLCGYLSEGHLEFTGNDKDPRNFNLERNHLMRKSFHKNDGEILYVAKVPPPPPLRTTSQLSKSKSLNEVHISQYQTEKSLDTITDKQHIPQQTQDEVIIFFYLVIFI
jgi:hypothetical protein